MLRKFKTMIAGMNVTELGEVAEQVMAIASSRAMAGAPSIERPPRRRPRRSDWVTYRVRIDLAGARPPIWRRLELSSTMFLDELHRVVQIAFGWTDTHLHRFALGESVWDQAAELYLCPFDVDEGEDDGVPTHEVRLDEVLVEVGD